MKTITILTHYEADDTKFSGDYLSVEILIDNVSIRTYGDYYHDKGDIAASAFVEGLLYNIKKKPKVKDEKTADGKMF